MTYHGGVHCSHTASALRIPEKRLGRASHPRPRTGSSDLTAGTPDLDPIQLMRFGVQLETGAARIDEDFVGLRQEFLRCCTVLTDDLTQTGVGVEKLARGKTSEKTLR